MSSKMSRSSSSTWSASSLSHRSTGDYIVVSSRDVFCNQSSKNKKANETRRGKESLSATIWQNIGIIWLPMFELPNTADRRSWSRPPALSPASWYGLSWRLLQRCHAGPCCSPVRTGLERFNQHPLFIIRTHQSRKHYNYQRVTKPLSTCSWNRSAYNALSPP